MALGTASNTFDKPFEKQLFILVRSGKWPVKMIVHHTELYKENHKFMI